MVIRVFVEKKPGFDVEARHMKADLRENLGLSQEQLAARLQLYGIEIGQKTISRIETGLRVVPDYELLWFARALETTSSWLLGEQE